MRSHVFIGVDPGTSLKRKSTGVACLIEKKGVPVIEISPVHIISDGEIIRSCIVGMSGRSSVIAGIDAPLSRPVEGTLRECEKLLLRQGIPCYPSGAKWVSDWVDKAIALRNWAEKNLNARVIEVYPYAARKVLDIGVGVNKRTKEGRQVIQAGLGRLIPGLDEINTLLSDDELDAILSAYTAYLEWKGDAEKLDGRDGAIYLPSTGK